MLSYSAFPPPQTKGFLGSEQLWSVQNKNKHLTTQTWSSLDAWQKYKANAERTRLIQKLTSDCLEEEGSEDTYEPYVKEKFQLDIDELIKYGR